MRIEPAGVPEGDGEVAGITYQIRGSGPPVLLLPLSGSIAVGAIRPRSGAALHHHRGRWRACGCCADARRSHARAGCWWCSMNGFTAGLRHGWVVRQLPIVGWLAGSYSATVNSEISRGGVPCLVVSTALVGIALLLSLVQMLFDA
jgi:hypothetical protein